MIERNLGNIERALRLFFGIGFAIWVFNQPHLNVIDWFVAAAALMLMLNGIFSRCFIWWMLGLNTYKAVETNCQ